jgi:signal peptidase I
MSNELTGSPGHNTLTDGELPSSAISSESGFRNDPRPHNSAFEIEGTGGGAPVQGPGADRYTLSEKFFGGVGDRMVDSGTGVGMVEHVRRNAHWYHQAWSLTLTLLLVLFLRFFVVTAFYIPSPSMLDTLKTHDRVFVNRLAYLFSKPKVGDIVVFNVPETIPDYDPEKPIWIKRVVGIAGNTVTIEHNRLTIDGKTVTDPPFFKHNTYFPRSINGDPNAPVIVPEDHILVFGDNSGNSYDSRYWGPIPVDRIVGKAFVRFWPLDRLGPLHGETVKKLALDY